MNLFNEPLYTLEKVSCIYLITCTANNARYVGSAISFRKRVKDHRNALKRNNHHCIYLQNCYNKHGDDFFTIEIIHSFDRIIEYKSADYKEILLKTEEEYIQKLKPELNSQLYPYTSFGNLGGGIPIYQYDKNGNFIREWSSSAEVRRTLGISPENGLTHNSAGGFQWSREKVESMGKYIHGSGSYTKCSLYDLWGNLIKTFDAITLMNEYLVEEDNTRSKDPQVLSTRLRRNYPGAIYEKYRVAYGDSPTLDNSLNLKQKKKIVVQYYEEDLNTPVAIWANTNVADRELNAHFHRYIENGINGYKYKNIILKILGS